MLIGPRLPTKIAPDAYQHLTIVKQLENQNGFSYYYHIQTLDQFVGVNILISSFSVKP